MQINLSWTSVLAKKYLFSLIIHLCQYFDHWPKISHKNFTKSIFEIWVFLGILWFFMTNFFYKNYILTTKIVVILFERFSDDTVEIFYRNGTDENHFFTLTEKTCGTYNCTLSDLQVAWKPVIPTVIHFP